VLDFITYSTPLPSRQLSIGIRAKLSINELNCLEREKKPKVGNVEEEVSMIQEEDSRKSTPQGVGDTSKASTPTGMKVDELTSELKVLKLQDKIA
jgi:hypothetical protein